MIGPVENGRSRPVAVTTAVVTVLFAAGRIFLHDYLDFDAYFAPPLNFSINTMLPAGVIDSPQVCEACPLLSEMQREIALAYPNICVCVVYRHSREAVVKQPKGNEAERMVPVAAASHWHTCQVASLGCTGCQPDILQQLPA